MIVSPQIGMRVRIVADHPWRGHAGKLVRWQTPYGGFGPVPVVLLDSGEECFVMNEEQWWTE